MGAAFWCSYGGVSSAKVKGKWPPTSEILPINPDGYIYPTPFFFMATESLEEQEITKIHVWGLEPEHSLETLAEALPQYWYRQGYQPEAESYITWSKIPP